MRDGHFKRGLDDSLLQALADGFLSPLVDAARANDLDLRIRNNYVNLYDQGQSLAKISWGASAGLWLAINRKYVGGERLGGIGAERAGPEYLEWRLSAPVATRWVRSLPELRGRAATYVGPEQLWERRLLDAHRTGVTTFVDRQVQDYGIRRKADLVGLSEVEGRVVFLVVEVKVGDNNGIQTAPGQVAEYIDILAPRGKLRRSVAASYAKVATQIRTLGFSAPDPALFVEGMPARGLVALCDYPHAKPELLRRSREMAAGLPRPTGFVLCAGDDGLGQPPSWQWIGANGA